MSALPTPPELQQAWADLVHDANAFLRKMVNHLGDCDVDALQRMAEATAAGHRLVIAIDVDTNDAQVRLMHVSADQVVTPLASLGLFPTSERRN